MTYRLYSKIDIKSHERTLPHMKISYLKLVTGKGTAKPEQHASEKSKNHDFYPLTAKACILLFKYEVS